MIGTFVFALVVTWTYAHDCGRTPIPPKIEQEPKSNKIVGGTVTVPYSWPWQVELCIKSWGTCDLQCGGTIIAPEWIMSAAHCVAGYENYPEFFGVKLGTYKYYDNAETGEVVRDVDVIHKHPKYGTPKRYSNDISLIHIKGGPVNYTDHIQPICIPRSVADVVLEGKLAYVTGWGSVSEGGEVSNELRQVHVPFLNMSHCEREYPGQIDDTMECAGRKGVDSCQGDSGGPLVTKHKDNDLWYQAGIVSWGNGCAEAGYAGVYQRPSAHCDFIKQHTGLDLCL